MRFVRVVKNVDSNFVEPAIEQYHFVTFCSKGTAHICSAIDTEYYPIYGKHTLRVKPGAKRRWEWRVDMPDKTLSYGPGSTIFAAKVMTGRSHSLFQATSAVLQRLLSRRRGSLDVMMSELEQDQAMWLLSGRPDPFRRQL